jgi:flagellar hook-length control protein FliK
VTVQVTQIQPTEPRLFQDTYTQTNSDNSFQNYLENEQKRLTMLFSPFNQFDFGSWFGYPELSFQTAPVENNVNLFSDSEMLPTGTYGTNTQNQEISPQNPLSASNPVFEQIASYYSASPTQATLQELLMKTGWLVPNMQASPQLYMAQLEGKMLNKLDLQFLVDQIVTQVKMIKEKGQTELTLGLKPENLGEIILSLTSRSGMISISIQAPEETRKLLEALLSELELALKKAKVNLADIKIVSPEEVNQHV